MQQFVREQGFIDRRLCCVVKRSGKRGANNGGLSFSKRVFRGTLLFERLRLGNRHRLEFIVRWHCARFFVFRIAEVDDFNLSLSLNVNVRLLLAQPVRDIIAAGRSFFCH